MIVAHLGGPSQKLLMSDVHASCIFFVEKLLGLEVVLFAY